MSWQQTEISVNNLTLDSQFFSDHFTVVRAVGELDLDTQDAFEGVVSGHLLSSSVVVDLSAVEFLAISALRSLMVCHAVAGTTGREIYYAGPTRQSRRLLAIAGLYETLSLRSSVDEVVCGSAPQPVLVRPRDGLADEPLGDHAQLDVG